MLFGLGLDSGLGLDYQSGLERQRLVLWDIRLCLYDTKTTVTVNYVSWLTDVIFPVVSETQKKNILVT